MDKENITVDVASSLAGNGGRKKSRSKSMGPGGLDVLKSGTGNRRVVCSPIQLYAVSSRVAILTNIDSSHWQYQPNPHHDRS
jgi:hypothetical protein